MWNRYLYFAAQDLDAAPCNCRAQLSARVVLAVWPLFVGFIALAATVEVVARFGTGLVFDRLGLRALC